MKKLLTICFMFILALGATAQTTNEIEFFQSIWGMEKQAMVEAYMEFSETDAAAFWPEYKAYEVSRKELGKERVMILDDYAKNYATLSSEKANELINNTVANNIAYQKLLKKTFKKMSRSVDADTIAKFIQMENYFINMIQMTIMENIPFVIDNN